MSELEQLVNKVMHSVKRMADVQKLLIDEIDVLTEDIKNLANHKQGGDDASDT